MIRAPCEGFLREINSNFPICHSATCLPGRSLGEVWIAESSFSSTYGFPPTRE
jgi:hypothetical protein